MKITTVFAAFAACSLFATGAFAQTTMQPIPNPPETQHPAHHGKTHHHTTHHARHGHHAAKTGDQTGGDQGGSAASNTPEKGGETPK